MVLGKVSVNMSMLLWVPCQARLLHERTVFLGKLIMAQLVKKLSAFYASLVHKSPLMVAILGEQNTAHAFEFYFFKIILILYYHLPLGLRSVLFTFTFRTNIMREFLISPIRATCPACTFILMVSGEGYKSWKSPLWNCRQLPGPSSFLGRNILPVAPSPNIINRCCCGFIGVETFLAGSVRITWSRDDMNRDMKQLRHQKRKQCSRHLAVTTLVFISRRESLLTVLMQALFERCATRSGLRMLWVGKLSYTLWPRHQVSMISWLAVSC
jgi:hypothetical protein